MSEQRTGASDWNFAEAWEVIADTRPDAPAQVHGDRRSSWADFDRRANGVATGLLEAGLQRQDKVAQYLYNCPEYLESFFAAAKAALVPFNTNYRYVDDELVYLWDNADAAAVVFHGTFASRIEGLRARVPRVREWLWVDDGSGPCPGWATPYEQLADREMERCRPAGGRSGDDLFFLYTGGTTGMPKGVMWRQDDVFRFMAEFGGRSDLGRFDPDSVRTLLADPGPVCVPGCPLMHGTGLFLALLTLDQGGCVVSLAGRSFDARELLDTIQRERANVAAIVGDAFAKPLLTALDAEPDRWDITSLFGMTSSGVMWSEETKQGLLRHHPGMLLLDGFSSSEAVGMGTSVSTGAEAAPTARFAKGPRARVITDDGRDVEPGSGEVGQVAVGGFVPVGYYKDPEKSARTFRVIDGQRYSVPGDFATIEADGTLRLLGRGSLCINTGGEKVYPEEVEEVLKESPGVTDAAVVGVPSERFGEAVVGVVARTPGAEVDPDALVAHAKSRLAGYKVPRQIVVVDDLARAANGKLDYKALRELATAQTAAAAVAE